MTSRVHSLRDGTRAGALSALALAIFRSHGALIEQGERLVEPLGLTSARWQVLGALTLAGGPLTVPAIAAAMGLTRQGVQKQIDRLLADGHLTQLENPGHKRSPLFEPSRAGRVVFRRADQRWARLSAQLAGAFSLAELETSRAVLDALARVLAPPTAQE